MKMAYTSPIDVRQVMRKLPSSITDNDIQFHIDKAEAYLNALLGGVFATPFGVPIPPIIKHVTTDLAVFFFAEDLYSSQQPNMDEYQEKRFNRVMKMIDEILDGTLIIGVPRIDKKTTGFDTTNEEDPIFTLDLPLW